MNKEISKIINNWDPIGLNGIGGCDEYDLEVCDIEEFLKSKTTISKSDLTKKINEIFIKWFGNDVYSAEPSMVELVAQEILAVWRR